MSSTSWAAWLVSEPEVNKKNLCPTIDRGFNSSLQEHIYNPVALDDP